MFPESALTEASIGCLPSLSLGMTWFASPGQIAMGVFTGLVFGFLLQRAHVTRYSTIVGQFLLKDFTVLKVMGTAIVIGAIGVYGMRAIGMEFDMHIKSATLLANGLGGLVFGVGMVVLGYCPGTGVAAMGDGSRHAVPGVAGMVVGAAVYAEMFPWVQRTLLGVGNLGKVTLPEVTGVPAWVFVGVLMLMAAAGFYMLERGRGPRTPGTPA